MYRPDGGTFGLKLSGEMTRLRAIGALRDVVVAQRDFERAAAVEKELLECQIARLGSDHPDTLATRADLSMILLEKISGDSSELSRS